MSSRQILLSFLSHACKQCKSRIQQNSTMFRAGISYSTKRPSTARDCINLTGCKSLILSSAIGISLFVKKQQEVDQAVEKTSQEVQRDEDNQIIVLLKHAKLSEMKQDYATAEELYHRALGIVNINQQHKLWSEERSLRAKVYIYDAMANLALARGEFAPAERLYKQVMQGLLQQGKKPDDNAIVEISLKLAVMFAAQNRVEDADTGYRFCIEMLETKMKDDDASKHSQQDDDTTALLGMCFDAYARFLIVCKDYSKAISYLQQALEIVTSLLGGDHQQVTVLLNDIATASSLLRDYELATRSLQQAIAIGELNENSHLSTLYCNLGALYTQTGDYNEARNQYLKAVSVAKRTNDKEVLRRAEEAMKSLDISIRA